MSNQVITFSFTDIHQIKAFQFQGFHGAHDSAAFKAIERFVLNTSHPVADRAEALRIQSDVGMGSGRMSDFSDDALLAAFIESL